MDFKKYTAFTDNRPVTTSTETTIINKQTMNQNNIKPQELMLGNWAQYNGVNYQIDSITTKGTWISTEKGMDSVRWEEVFPIPLSEEVLLRCGFKHLAHAPWLLTNGRLTINKGNHDIFTFGNQVLNCEIKYLHQLQNLYHSLTQTELEVSWS